nr:protein kinase-like domain, phloem protein 2-like protein [Tanacetum cinerariifolium]
TVSTITRRPQAFAMRLSNKNSKTPLKAVIADNKNTYLVSLAIIRYREKTLCDIIDPDLWKKMDSRSFNILVKVAYDCLNKERPRCPNIDDIVLRLEKALELQLKPESYDNSIGERVYDDCGKKILVYNYTSKRSLDFYLNDKDPCWSSGRFVAVDDTIASTLLYYK